MARRRTDFLAFSFAAASNKPHLLSDDGAAFHPGWKPPGMFFFTGTWNGRPGKKSVSHTTLDKSHLPEVLCHRLLLRRRCRSMTADSVPAGRRFLQSLSSADRAVRVRRAPPQCRWHIHCPRRCAVPHPMVKSRRGHCPRHDCRQSGKMKSRSPVLLPR